MEAQHTCHCPRGRQCTQRLLAQALAQPSATVLATVMTVSTAMTSVAHSGSSLGLMVALALGPLSVKLTVAVQKELWLV